MIISIIAAFLLGAGFVMILRDTGSHQQEIQQIRTVEKRGKCEECEKLRSEIARQKARERKVIMATDQMVKYLELYSRVKGFNKEASMLAGLAKQLRQMK